MPENLTPIEKIDAMLVILNKLADATGVEKASYVVVIGDLLNRLKKDLQESENSTGVSIGLSMEDPDQPKEEAE